MKLKRIILLLVLVINSLYLAGCDIASRNETAQPEASMVDIDCEKAIIGRWEGDRTVVDSGKPKGGSYLFSVSAGTRTYLHMSQGSSNANPISGTWECINGDSPVIILSHAGTSEELGITFTGYDKVTLTRMIGNKTFPYDYFRVDE